MRSTFMSRWSAQALYLPLVLVGLMMFAFPGSAKAEWWQKDWPYRKEITLDTSPSGVDIRQSIGRAPLLVRLHTGNFRFDDAAPDGSDLRFVAADDKTPLAFHIESFDPLLGVATIWVDIKSFPVGGKASIWLYYGNRKAAPAGDAAATFDADYTAIYHFDTPAGSAPKDKTAFGDNAQTAPAGIDDGAVIGKGARFTGAGPMLIGASPALAVSAGAPFTFSAWVRPDHAQPQAALFVRRDGAGALVAGLDQGAPFVTVGAQRLAASAPLVQGQWSHIAFVADGKSFTLFVNGRPVATAAGAMPALSSAIAVGGDAPGGGLPGFQGGMDEVRVSRVARSAALIQMDAVSQGAESRLTAFGADQKQASGGFGYFGVIVRSVTPDAWVVISLLGLMGVASWYVMWIKAAYVGRVDRANERFLSLFRQHSDDPLALTHQKDLQAREADRLRDSSLFRLYSAGAGEIQRREAPNGRVRIRSEVMDVVRAVMDASLVRETQRLSSAMVLLTISISGGPFLGLLGTVVGVMITFAAIAAAGEVNVNAIAPGIAAALLATVAGLGVAIPALFGYNYILTRNKAVQANMQVFVDEFVTRVFERYGDQAA